ncbi:LPS export ABC transporter periplasmic protein LptC [Siphonobacter curvatus]|uniref:LPS export ABC transporter periplasmic protein LptC n=2 Tax=Siphonobacter curvatus TaxID=2094562 RepID=A0A2S7IKP5_9BACT|nr:LPS export ABC transporter periplasmic protein LptC [Siphonobacter curvatus]
MIEAMRQVTLFLTCILLSAFGLMACEEKQVVSSKPYTGPQQETYDVQVVYSDSGHKVIRMVTPVQLDLLTGDRIFPKEIRLYFYDKAGTEHTWLRADSGRYIRMQNLYRMIGHVKIENRIKQETLETDELFWSPDRKRIYTDRPVTSRTPTGVTNGTGLVATQDFKQYGLGKVRNSQMQVNDLPE